jgi:poly(A) polymerase
MSVRGPDRFLCVQALITRFLERHTENRPTQARSTQANLLLTRSQNRIVTRLAQIQPEDIADLRRFLSRWSESWLEAAVLSRALQPEPDLETRGFLKTALDLVKAEGETVLHPQPLLDGQEIQQLLGLPQGPEIGRLLDTLLDAQLRGEVTGRKDAVALLLNERSPPGE